jgi:hypothetical protein
MSTDDATTRDPKFSFGVRELRQAQLEADLAQQNTAEITQMDPGLRVAANESRGFDPYNSTGSFDRNRAWARVLKR